jgi:hypothetical protein
MTDRRPARVYGVLRRGDRVFLRSTAGGLGLPGGAFRPLAEDRKVELRAHIHDQLGVEAKNIWAQGAFAYRDACEAEEAFCGFYTVWDWDGGVPGGAGRWLDKDEVADEPGLPPSLSILLLSILDTVALKTR